MTYRRLDDDGIGSWAAGVAIGVAVVFIVTLLIFALGGCASLPHPTGSPRPTLGQVVVAAGEGAVTGSVGGPVGIALGVMGAVGSLYFKRREGSARQLAETLVESVEGLPPEVAGTVKAHVKATARRRGCERRLHAEVVRVTRRGAPSSSASSSSPAA